MRKFKLDNKKVFAPNASHIGFDLWHVKRGSCFTYDRQGDTPHGVARSLGRIAWCDNDGADCRGHVCALVLSACATHAYVRWIDPKDITQIVAPPTKFAAFFFAAALPYSPERMLQLADYGTLSEHYIGNAAHHVNAWNHGVSPAAWNAGVHSPK